MFPVHRIYCIGRNYLSHAIEMGGPLETPFFFAKPHDAIVTALSPLVFPSKIQNLQHEIELVVALGQGGNNIPVTANAYIFGYAIGLDMTQRDLQMHAKKMGRPWEVSKGFDQSAPVSAIYPVTSVGILQSGDIWLKVNGALRQAGDLSQMIWPVAHIISVLSEYFTLQAGDIIFTGTPSGVGKVEPGDTVQGGIAGLGELRVQF
jgi:fumarylpyruvate hydrolase